MNDSFSQFQLLLDNLTDYAIFFLDGEGKITSWSQAARNVFGYTADEIQGKPFSILFPLQENPDQQASRELRFASAHGRYEDTRRLRRKDGSELWAESVLCPVRSPQGEIQGFSQIIRDVTERRLAEQTLRQREEELQEARKLEAIGRLAGGVAHDFNNFVTGIIGLTEEICQSFDSSDPRREDCEALLQTADRARVLTRQLLAFGRRQMSAPTLIDLNAELKDKQKIFGRLLGAGIRLNYRLDEGLRSLLIDPTHLDQILVNLLMNARDAMPNGGDVSIETRHTPADRTATQTRPVLDLALIVSDTGSGMDAEVLSHLFEPFYTTKPQGKGTGLGLATIHGIVRQNHGTISITSETGKGTTITLLFPSVSAPATISAESTEARPTTGWGTILLVEDEEVVRQVASRTLTRHGYDVLSAASGEDALALANKNPVIHLLLTDVMMPGMNGKEVAQAFQKIHPQAGILYMSAYPRDILSAGEKPGAHASYSLVEKPFTSEALLNHVHDSLRSVPPHPANPEKPR